METAVEIRGVAIQQRSRRVPLHKHHGVPRPAFDPDVVDLDMKVWQDAADTLYPAPHRLLVVALATDAVRAAEAMMDIWRNRLEQLIALVTVDVIKTLSN